MSKHNCISLYTDVPCCTSGAGTGVKHGSLVADCFYVTYIIRLKRSLVYLKLYQARWKGGSRGRSNKTRKNEDDQWKNWGIIPQFVTIASACIKRKSHPAGICGPCEELRRPKMLFTI